jgi:hypothetical protein
VGGYYGTCGVEKNLWDGRISWRRNDGESVRERETSVCWGEPRLHGRKRERNNSQHGMMAKQRVQSARIPRRHALDIKMTYILELSSWGPETPMWRGRPPPV